MINIDKLIIYNTTIPFSSYDVESAAGTLRTAHAIKMC